MNSSPKQSVKIPLSKEGFTRLTQGHPWLFRRHLDATHPWPKVPSVLSLGEHLFFYSPQSDLALRRFGPSQRHYFGALPHTITEIEDFAAQFSPNIKTFLSEAWDRRRILFPEEGCFRWVFSECDFLPGLIIDRFENYLSVQIQTAPLEKFWPVFKKLIEEVFQGKTQTAPSILELRNSTYRKKEGLEVTPNSVPPVDLSTQWNGLQINFRLGGGQKTGSYLDQASNHRLAASWAEKLKLKEAWDLCTFEGGFALHLAQKGLQVLAVDASEEALSQCQANALANGLRARIQTEKADVFTFLKDKHLAKTQTDMIVLDPPSFLKSKSDFESARRGFKELNLRAMHSLKKGGLLVSCSCSQNMGEKDFQDMLRAAAHDARREIRVLDKKGPSPDHSPLTNFPESNYLQACYLWVL